MAEITATEAEKNVNLMAEPPEITATEAEKNVNLMAEPPRKMMAEPPRKMRVMIAMNMSNIPKYQSYVTSYSSSQAFDWIVDIITRSGSSAFVKLYIVYVQVPIKQSIHNRIPCFGSVAVDEWPQGYWEEGERFLLRLQIRCREAKIESRRILLRGVPEIEICEAVRVVEPDLLVMGSRGLSAFRRLYVKSVSEYVVKHVACPVIRIKRSIDWMPDPYNSAKD